MRTAQEKQRQVEGLKKQKEALPEYSFFGDNNWEAIDAMISIIMELTTYADYENDEPHIESEAYRCQCWLNGESDDDLFDEM